VTAAISAAQTAMTAGWVVNRLLLFISVPP
jgi:hypothetical protein